MNKIDNLLWAGVGIAVFGIYLFLQYGDELHGPTIIVILAVWGIWIVVMMMLLYTKYGR